MDGTALDGIMAMDELMAKLEARMGWDRSLCSVWKDDKGSPRRAASYVFLPVYPRGRTSSSQSWKP